MFDIEYEDYLCNLGRLYHNAVNPPREGFIGENVYAQKWCELMEKEKLPEFSSYEYDCIPNIMLAYILQEFPHYINQQHATICASIVTWLGTNCGQCALREANHLAKSMPASKAYIAAWSISNMRNSAVNMGYRTLEFLLNPREDRVENLFNPFLNLPPVDINADAYEVAEHLWVWLSTEQGQQFITTCELEIEFLQQQDHLKRSQKVYL